MDSGYWTSALSQRVARRRALASFGGMAIGTALLAACGGSKSTDAPTDRSGLLATPADLTAKATPGGVLQDYQNADVLHLDPYTSNIGSVRQTAAYAYPRVMKFVPAKYPKVADYSTEGDLAESYEVSGDKLQITFKIRPGLKWDARAPTNGRVIDAQDLIASWARFGAVNTFAAPSLIYDANTSPHASVESVSALDRNTVVMKLHRPDASILINLAANDSFYILPRESDGQYDPKRDIRGHGPWLLDEWRPSAYFRWKRNPDYYVKGRPYYDRVEKPIVTEYAQQLAQFRAGNIHTSVVQAQDVIQTKKDLPQTRLLQENEFITSASPYLRFGYEGDSPFKDVRVRQAVSLSIDRAGYLDVLDNLEAFRRDGFDVPVAYNSVVGAGWVGYALDPTNEKEFGPSARYLKYDRAEAKKLMAAAGYANGLDFDFFYNQENQFGVNYARTRETYPGMLAEVGLRARMKGFPQAQYQDQYLWAYISKQFISGEKKGYNGILLAQTRPYPTLDRLLVDLFHKNGAIFFGLTPDGRNAHLGDPKINDVIDKILIETDRRRQEGLVHDFIRYFTEQAYAIPRPGISKGLGVSWPVIGNEGAWNTVGVPAGPGQPSSPGNQQVESRIHWWYDASQPPAKA